MAKSQGFRTVGRISFRKAFRIPYPRALEVISPVIPGGVLVAGELFVNKALSSRFLGVPWGYCSRIALVISAAYVIGFVLTYTLAGCGTTTPGIIRVTIT